ncbi:MAG: hypothetical protein OEV28_08620 [Nitrospirota bacterium]|nr:hypothetical protein [Nitrospirota bacterium]
MLPRLSVLLLFISTLCACAGAALTYTPTETSDGSRGYHLYTVYGGLDGTREQASAVLDREATRLCKGEFVTINEEEHDRLTRWGSKNGQIDYLRLVKCKASAEKNEKNR